MNQSPNDVMDYRGRQRRVAQGLEARRLDALLVTHLPNVRYLCGFTGSAGVLLVANGRSTFFTDGRYREQAGAEVEGARVVVPKGAVLDAAARALADLRVRNVGLESEHLSVAAAAKVARTLRTKARLRQTLGLVEDHRMVKEPAEVACLRAAVRLGSSLFDKAGADGMSFETIVAAGPRSALPHGLASAQPIPRRGFVVLDFGVILCGYCSDMTRTVHVGKPAAEARKLYQAVRDAQQAALDAVRPG